MLKLFLTYLKRNERNGKVYVGRTSGDAEKNTPEDARKILRKRDTSHHKTREGYGIARIDKVSDDADAIRGR